MVGSRSACLTPSDAINLSQRYHDTRFPRDYVLLNQTAPILPKDEVHTQQNSTVISSSSQRPSQTLASTGISNISEHYHQTCFPHGHNNLNSKSSIYTSDELRSGEGSAGSRVSTQISPKTLTYSLTPRPSPNRHRTWWQRHLSGWSVGVAGCALLVSLTLMLNIVFLIFNLARGEVVGGFALLYQGSCSKSASLMLWFHVMINLLSTALLSASNYCMQILSSPTRAEIDNAHSKKKWLDIGLQSLRNLTSVSRKTRIMWWVLVVSSMPLHLMYNSAVFAMLSTSEYYAVFATPDFLQPQLPENLTAMLNPEVLTVHSRLQNISLSFQKLDAQTCLKDYSSRYVADRSHLIVVLQQDWNSVDPFMNTWGWTNKSSATVRNSSLVPYFGASLVLQPLDIPELLNMTKTSSISYQRGLLAIDHCLSEIATGGCRVLTLIPVLVIVICCNILKAVAMVMLFRSRNSRVMPLVTIGDAVESFIAHPDPTTRDMCLYDRKMIENGLWENAKTAQRYIGRKRLWFGACSTRRWIITNLLAAITLTVIGRVDFSFPTTSTDTWTLGFTTVSANTIIDVGNAGQGLPSIISNLLLANLPQAMLALLFLSYNNLFTFMYAADEWSRFAYDRKTLRVTSPTGDQRSTYWLQMPYKAAVPLILTSFLFHWLSSQSVFFARLAIYDLNGNYSPENDISTIGYSLAPVVLLLCLGIIVLPVFGIGSGFRTFRPGLPVAGGCSAVISAACHGVEGKGKDEVLRPLMWGVVLETEPVESRDEGLMELTQERDELWNPTERPGHCAFSSIKLNLPSPGHFYK